MSCSICLQVLDCFTQHNVLYLRLCYCKWQDFLLLLLFFFLRLNACVHAQLLSGVWLFGTLWTVVCQAPLSMGFSRQEHWNGLPFLPSWDLPNLGQTHVFCIAGRFFTTDPLGKPYSWILFTYQQLSLSPSLCLLFIRPSVSTEHHIFSIQSSKHACFLTIGHQFHHQHWVSIVGAADFNSTVLHAFRRYNTGHLLWAGGADSEKWAQWVGPNR